jgi:hypothetical protein
MAVYLEYMSRAAIYEGFLYVHTYHGTCRIEAPVIWVGNGGGGRVWVFSVVICAYHFWLSDMIILIRWDWVTPYIEIVLYEAWTVK